MKKQISKLRTIAKEYTKIYNAMNKPVRVYMPMKHGAIILYGPEKAFVELTAEGSKFEDSSRATAVQVNLHYSSITIPFNYTAQDLDEIHRQHKKILDRLNFLKDRHDILVAKGIK